MNRRLDVDQGEAAADDDLVVIRVGPRVAAIAGIPVEAIGAVQVGGRVAAKGQGLRRQAGATGQPHEAPSERAGPKHMSSSSSGGHPRAMVIDAPGLSNVAKTLQAQT